MVINPTEKIWYLDNLKIALTVLVIIHHVGQGYGPGGWWYFQSHEKLEWLKLMFVLNRSFFMSLFFMISGYLLANSLNRTKNYLRFCLDRLKRFGLPLALFGFGILPLLLFNFHLHAGDIGGIDFLTYYTQFYLGINSSRPAIWMGASWPDLQLGHLWFIEHLLILSLIAAGLHKIGILKLLPKQPISRYKTILFLLVLAITTIVVRHYSPIDKWVGLLGFIQVAFADVPRDLFFFVFGIHAARSQFFSIKQKGYWKPLITTGLILAIVYAILLFTPSLKLVTIKASWWGSVFPIWESIYCYCLCVGLVLLFRDLLNKTNRFVCTLGKLSFGSYLVHVPVVVVIQYQLVNLNLPLTFTFILACILGVLITFGTTYFYSFVKSMALGKKAI